MKIGVYGGTLLAQVTAACMAIKHEVVFFGPRLPIQAPPNLDEWWAAGDKSGRLRVVDSADEASGCPLLWCCQDTPVDSNNMSDLGCVVRNILEIAAHLQPGSIVLVSSQVPVGTTRLLAETETGKKLLWAHSPENLRRQHAIDDFLRPTRVVIGVESGGQDQLQELFRWFMPRPDIQWVSLETAEFVKHALNAILGTTIALTNEIADLAKLSNVDPIHLEVALRSEPRIGPGLPVRAGEGFTGGTLGRDLKTLEMLGKGAGLPMTLVSAVLESNARRLKL